MSTRPAPITFRLPADDAERIGARLAHAGARAGSIGAAILTALAAQLATECADCGRPPGDGPGECPAPNGRACKVSQARHRARVAAELDAERAGVAEGADPRQLPLLPRASA